MEWKSWLRRAHVSLQLVGAVAVFALAVFAACSDAAPAAPDPTAEATRTPRAAAPTIETEPNLKVAFIGDSGNGEGFRAVLRLIKDEGADLIMHQGDFDYELDPDGWFATIDSVLGPDFPLLATLGNHDGESWPEGCGDPDGCYADFVKERMSRLGIAPDSPDLNDEMYAVDYLGLKMVFVGQENSRSGGCHEDPAGYACFIENQLEDDHHIWRICSWHENQEIMQVGDQHDTLGWGVYENCRTAGAIVATAHHHSYERTKTLISIEHPVVDPVMHPVVDGVPSNPNSLRVAPGASFVFVSGLGGFSAREQQRCFPETYPYGCNLEWASIYTQTQAGGEAVGALFIDFHVDGDPLKARGYFKTTDGQIIDRFDITASAPVGSAP